MLQIIRAHRLEREADYAAQRELEWEQALAEEAERHRPVPAHFRPHCSCITLIAFLCWQHCCTCHQLHKIYRFFRQLAIVLTSCQHSTSVDKNTMHTGYAVSEQQHKAVIGIVQGAEGSV